MALWRSFTNLSPEKMAPAISLSLTGRACEAALELDVAKLNSAHRVDEIFTKLDTMYLKDMKLHIYNAYDDFEQFKHTRKMTINDYLIEFERSD